MIDVPHPVPPRLPRAPMAPADPPLDHPGLTFLGWYPNAAPGPETRSAASTDPDRKSMRLRAEWWRLSRAMSRVTASNEDEQVELVCQALARARRDVYRALAEADPDCSV